MRNPLRRYYGRGDLHFVTFSCYRRHPLLGTRRARDRFVAVLDQVRSRFGFRLVGYVVMPEHVHLLMSEPETANPSKALQVLKQNASRALGRRGTRSSPEIIASGPGGLHFWQRRFYDFNVWSSEKVREKLEYMHANPVKRKLVEYPKDWPWSSWSHYANGEEGLITIDSPAQNPHPTYLPASFACGGAKGAAPAENGLITIDLGLDVEARDHAGRMKSQNPHPTYLPASFACGGAKGAAPAEPYPQRRPVDHVMLNY